MALPDPSILSEISTHLSDLVTNAVSGRPQVRIGPPADAEPKDTNSEPIVNLFLYRIEPSGFYPDAGSQDALQVRIHCLVTAYSSPTSVPGGNGSDTIVSAGEINLRLLGSLIQVFHEHPVRDIVFRRSNPETLAEEEIRTSLQIVFKPLSSEEINQIWATQGDTAYRASLAYELALAPITPWTARPAPDLAGSVELAVSPIPAGSGNGAMPGGDDGPLLAAISETESAMVQAGKDNPPELQPELLVADALPGNRRIVRGWIAEPEAGGDPEFVTEADSVAMTFAPYAGLTDHTLSVFEKSGGGDWRRIQSSPVADPEAGQSSTPVDFPLIKQPGEWMFYVESVIPANGGSMATLRSNIAAVEIRQVAEPVDGGGSP